MKTRMMTITAPLAITLFLITSCAETDNSRVHSVEIPPDLPASFLSETDPSAACKCADHEHEDSLCIKCEVITLPAGSKACICSYSVANP